MYDKIIVDADICIKLGSKDKYPFLTEVLPLLAQEIYIHSQAYSEVLIPNSACRQLKELVSQKKVIVVNQTELDPQERSIYDMVYNQLANLMIDPRRPNKNKGEVCSLSQGDLGIIRTRQSGF